MLKEIIERYSPLIFADKKIEESVLHSLFEAAGKAPSSFNEQPWRFFYAHQQSKSFNLVLQSMTSYNQLWAKTASVLVIIGAKKWFSHNQQENQHARFDTGTAVGFFLLQAMHVGIYAHLIGGFDQVQLRKSFNIDDSIDIIALMALGYPGDPSLLPEELQVRAQTRTPRKKLEEIVFQLL